MSDSSFKMKIKNLSWQNKIVGISSFLLIISAFLPWYKDLDKFNTGDMFLGITGPLYLTGFTVLLSGIVSFFLISFGLLEKSLPKFPFKTNQIHIFGGIISIVMVLLAASVYFHPKFGVNTSEKTAGIGMISGLIMSIANVIGGVLLTKKETQTINTDNEIQEILQERNANGIKNYSTPTTVNQIKINNNLRPKNPNLIKSASGFRTPFQQSIPDSYFSKDAFARKDQKNLIDVDISKDLTIEEAEKILNKN